MAARLSDVPREWVFEHYLQLGEALTGQNVQIKSVFNTADKKPSLFVFMSQTKHVYYFKDFSTDNSGDGTSLVKSLFGLTTRGEAAHKIIEDYNKHVLSDPDAYKNRVIKIREKYRVVGFKTRKWTVIDSTYWKAFHIGSSRLAFREVRPISEYVMQKPNDPGSQFVVKGSQIYGYFCEDGTLHKIYQPLAPQNKFMRVKSHIQGSEQLTGEKPYLVICSSMKDMMVLGALNVTNIECVAPDSENVLIPEEEINKYKETYKAICTLFDNDQAGIRSMNNYEERYDIPGVHLKVEKDLAECIKEHGIRNTRVHLFPLLTKALKQ